MIKGYNKKNILIVSNMYPSEEFPFFGTFVKNCESVLVGNDFVVDKVVIDEKSSNLFNKFKIYIFFYFCVLRKLFLGNYDYVYGHYVSHVSIPLLIYRLFNSKIDIVIHVHGGDIKKLDGTSSVFFKVKRFLSASILKKSSKIIVPSYAYKAFLNEAFNFTTLSEIIVYPSGGVDRNVFYSGKEKRTFKHRLGFAGRLVRSKNVHLILYALSQTSDFTLEIVGEGPERTRLIQLVDKLNLRHRVFFYDAKSQSELADWYRSIDCLVYPSESESLGLVPIEAMSCGSSVILSDIPAFREFRSNGFDIHMVATLEAEAILDKLVYCKASGNGFVDSNNNINVITEKYCRDKVQRDLLNVFK